MKSLETQVAGNHYKQLKVEPAFYCLQNNLGCAEANIVKYVSRHKFKNGIEDLKKAQHWLSILIEHLEQEKINNIDGILIQEATVNSTTSNWTDAKITDYPLNWDISSEHTNQEISVHRKPFDASYNTNTKVFIFYTKKRKYFELTVCDKDNTYVFETLSSLERIKERMVELKNLYNETLEE